MSWVTEIRDEGRRLARQLNGLDESYQGLWVMCDPEGRLVRRGERRFGPPIAFATDHRITPEERRRLNQRGMIPIRVLHGRHYSDTAQRWIDQGGVIG